jgi:hypothetical protein
VDSQVKNLPATAQVSLLALLDFDSVEGSRWPFQLKFITSN